MDDQQLQRAYQNRTAVEHRQSCPNPESLARLAAGEFEAARREPLLDHLEQCSRCAEELTLLLEAQPELEQLAHRAAKGGNPSRRFPWRRLLVPAMAMVVLAAVLVWVLPSQDPGAPQLRGNATEEAANVVPGEGATLRRIPVKFRWAALSGDIRYRLVVLHADATPAWTSSWLTDNEVVVGEELGEMLSGESTWLWRVEVDNGGGERVLGPYWFELEP